MGQVVAEFVEGLVHLGDFDDLSAVLGEEVDHGALAAQETLGRAGAVVDRGLQVQHVEPVVAPLRIREGEIGGAGGLVEAEHLALLPADL